MLSYNSPHIPTHNKPHSTLL